jgi:Cu+-exporting ATPase
MVMDRNLQDAMAKDPVCGMDVDPHKAAFTYTHEGNTFVFCSRGCLLDFKDDPPRYLDPKYQPSGMDDMPV